MTAGGRHLPFTVRSTVQEEDEERLRGFLDAIDAAGDLIPKQGPDATAFAAINFMKSLTASLGLLH